MTRAARLGAILGLVLILAAAAGNVASADHLRVVCEVSARPSAKVEQGYVISARIATTDGRPVNEATVRFYEVVDLFGAREMSIATATTDGQGRASTSYLPARPGKHDIVVRFSGREHFGPAAGRVTFEGTVAAPPYRQEPMRLADFTAKVPYGVGAVVLSVWAVIAFAFLGTARGVLGDARGPVKKGDTA